MAWLVSSLFASFLSMTLGLCLEAYKSKKLKNFDSCIANVLLKVPYITTEAKIEFLSQCNNFFSCFHNDNDYYDKNSNDNLDNDNNNSNDKNENMKAIFAVVNTT